LILTMTHINSLEVFFLNGDEDHTAFPSQTSKQEEK